MMFCVRIPCVGVVLLSHFLHFSISGVGSLSGFCLI
ncbi:hypothetical protein SLEP1_g16671 [Rubroshorea leprosula]|uniref:Uncharacterized protein n=1 Tax=Rubroshorea leprosula TaxID=152421 RepID=A0AAV5IZ62_9ROSI|nr:hypothetical protein SLEP1_g16671 [Rubroshorea leprosula]